MKTFLFASLGVFSAVYLPFWAVLLIGAFIAVDCYQSVELPEQIE